ncbi:dihydrofolate reductase [Nodosilinea sp. LEGE 07088]|uniref:dihydrofolate reductase family protein n=1 Tax=Nodosilinea sp. LEGE 07088 TaxID=2777968 RepID=UPI0018808A6C|nr:dihydrofolate reductase family protein [Nodosilinea sp. LEGE 07088]MBE9137109.1 dihydrofolate reductase [Nodosilinea sp. LEGE 07088]
MTTIYYTATSLDGFIADPNNSLDWLFQFGELEPNTFDTFLAGVGAIAMGSTTYQWIYDNQIAPATGDPQPWPYQVPAWVFTSRQLPTLANADVRFVSGNVRPIHQEMAIAAGDKNLWIVGGGDLAGQFYDAGLLDEIVVQIASVTLGGGAPLFPRPVDPPLQLLSAKTYGRDFVELYYRVSYT